MHAKPALLAKLASIDTLVSPLGHWARPHVTVASAVTNVQLGGPIEAIRECGKTFLTKAETGQPLHGLNCLAVHAGDRIERIV